MISVGTAAPYRIMKGVAIIKRPKVKYQEISVQDITRDPILARNCPPSEVSQYTSLTNKFGNVAGVVVGVSGEDTPRLIYGHPIIESYRQTGIKHIAATVIECDASEQAELSLRFYLLKKSHDVIGESMLIHELLYKHKVCRKDILTITGMSKGWLSRREHLAKDLCPAVRDLVLTGVLPSRIAETISRIPEKSQPSFAASVKDNLLTLKEVDYLTSHFNKLPCGDPERDTIIHDPTALLPARTGKPGHRRSSSAMSIIKMLIGLVADLVGCINDSNQPLSEPTAKMAEELLQSISGSLVPALSNAIKNCFRAETVTRGTDNG